MIKITKVMNGWTVEYYSEDITCNRVMIFSSKEKMQEFVNYLFKRL